MVKYPVMTITVLGDTTLQLTVASTINDESLQAVTILAEMVRAAAWPEVVDIVPSFTTVTLHLSSQSRLVDLMNRLALFWEDSVEPPVVAPNEVEIPVCYGGEFGPDLEQAAAAARMSVDDVRALHAAGNYRVHAIGFLPGFPYLAGLPAKLHCPRRDTPRTELPAGSVGIGGAQTGVYPMASPGGWQLIGRTPLHLFDVDREPAAVLKVGDRVKFAEIDEARYDELSASRETEATERQAGDDLSWATFEVRRPGIMTMVQDGGRSGTQHIGVPEGGAADRQSLRIANILVGNPESAAGLEWVMQGPKLLFWERRVVAVTGAEYAGVPSSRPFVVEAGEELDLGTVERGFRGYLAVSGGIDVPMVLNGQGTYLRGKFGGLQGRTLRRGDLLGAGTPVAIGVVRAGRVSADLTTPLPEGTESVLVVAEGETDDFDLDSLQRFWGGVYQVRQDSDRMGLRLSGPGLACIHQEQQVSAGVAPGTIQVPPDGGPIVLLADRQTIGGYPRIGSVASVDLPKLAQIRPGGTVRFVAVDHQDAETLRLANERDLGFLKAGARRLLQLQSGDLRIDLNCDLGEGMGRDAEIMPFITSANVASGGHAGDEETMRATVLAAEESGVVVGAHPGFEDREHFGRRELDLSHSQIEKLMTVHIERLRLLTSVRHVKPHGALYNMAARDEHVARAIVRAVVAVDKSLVLVGLSGGKLLAVAEELEVRVAHEVFADRRYRADGSLVPRSDERALIHDVREAVAQVIVMVESGRERTVEGTWIRVRADTVCIHGDGPNAPELAGHLREVLARRGIRVASMAIG